MRQIQFLKASGPISTELTFSGTINDVNADPSKALSLIWRFLKLIFEGNLNLARLPQSLKALYPICRSLTLLGTINDFSADPSKALSLIQRVLKLTFKGKVNIVSFVHPLKALYPICRSLTLFGIINDDIADPSNALSLIQSVSKLAFNGRINVLRLDFIPTFTLNALYPIFKLLTLLGTTNDFSAVLQKT